MAISRSGFAAFFSTGPAGNFALSEFSRKFFEKNQVQHLVDLAEFARQTVLVLQIGVDTAANGPPKGGHFEVGICGIFRDRTGLGAELESWPLPTRDEERTPSTHIELFTSIKEVLEFNEVFFVSFCVKHDILGSERCKG